MSNEKTNIWAKVMQVQQTIGKLSKEKTNPFFHSQYFDVNQVLESLIPIIGESKLAVMQPLSNIDGQAAIKTIVADPESGETIQESIPLPVGTNPQNNGSAITYYRRYALVSFFGIQAEDDDANKASGNATQKSGKQAKDDGKPWLNENTEEWKKAVEFLKNGYTNKTGTHIDGSIPMLQKKYKISKSNQDKLQEQSL